MNTISKYIRHILFFVLLANKAYTQEKIVKNYTTVDGLSSNFIYNIIQSHDGYIWIATINGVSRFDGKHFVNFNTQNGLPDNEVINVLEDKAHRIWFNSFSGKNAYLQKGKIYTKKNDSILKQFSSTLYYKIKEEKNTYTLINTTKPIDISIDSSGKMSLLNAQKYEFKFGAFQVIFDGRKMKLIHNGQIVDTCQVPIMVNNNVMYLDKDRLCISHDSTICIYRFDNNRIYLDYFKKFERKINNVFKSNKTLYMILYENLIYRIDSAYQLKKIPVSISKKATIQSVFVDAATNFWYATKGQGIFLVPNTDMRIYTDKESLAENYITTLAKENADVYLGFNNSSILKKTAGQIIDFNINRKLALSNTIKQIKITTQYIYYITENLCYRIDKKSKIITPSTIDNCKSIAIKGDTSILIGRGNSVLELDKNFIVKDTVFRKRSTYVHYMYNGDIIIGTPTNAMRIAQGSTVPIPILPSAYEYSVNTIESRKDILFLGTIQAGLFIVKNNQIKHIDFSNGLLTNNCKSISKDDQGNIWVASDLGVTVVKIDDNLNYSCSYYTQFNGLPTNYINHIEVVKDTVYVASSEGLFQFPLSFLHDRIQKPMATIAAIKTKDSFLFDVPQTIELNYDKSSIKLFFSALNYKCLGNMLYAYRLKGYSDGWDTTLNDHCAFDYLPPGRYELELHFKNCDEQWSKKPYLLQINVIPHFTQTLLFKTIIAILLFSAILYFIYFIMRQRTRKKIIAEQLQTQIAEIQLSALKAQINPHFIFNTLNSIQYYISVAKSTEAEEHINRLSKLIRHTLEFSEQTQITLSQELDYLHNYFNMENIRFNNELNFEVEVYTAINTNDINIPALVLQPLLENAIKHGITPMQTFPKTVHLRIQKLHNVLHIELSDNGIGITTSLQQKGLPTNAIQSKGIQLAKDKLAIYSKISGKHTEIKINDLSDIHTNKTGTLIQITLEL